MKRAILLGVALSLAGCGGGAPREPARGFVVRTAPVASGPINTACQQSNREGRTRGLCGCIQAAADQTLTQAQQRRSVAFYTAPELAQEVRQSDRQIDRQFWEAYVNYGKRAEQICG